MEIWLKKRKYGVRTYVILLSLMTMEINVIVTQKVFAQLNVYPATKIYMKERRK